MDDKVAPIRPELRTAPAIAPVPVAAPAAPAPAPKKGRGRLVLLALVLIAASIGGWKFYGWFTEGRFVVSTDDAYVKADQSIVAAKISGLVASVAVEDNQAVRAGDVLVALDDGDYKLAVDAARGRMDTQDAAIARIDQQIRAQQFAVEQAAAGLAASQAEQSRAALAFTRAEQLSRSGNASVAALDQARADRDHAAAGVAGGRAGVEAANAGFAVLRAQRVEAERTRAELAVAVARAERDLDFATIRAPFDGVVGNRAAQPGQYVQPGTRLLAVVPLDRIYVQANFKETQVARLKPGQPADIVADAFPGRTIRGTVASVAPASGAEFSLLPPENATGNFTKIVQRLQVRIALPREIAAEGFLRPGMSVTAGVRVRDEPTP
jgi:membrane fusion protein (multidrug efflux system)